MSPHDEDRDEDALWREIVDHWGEVADDSPAAEVPSADSPEEPPAGRPVEDAAPLDAWNPVPFDPGADDERFVPPDPGPTPLPSPPRLLAWIGVLGAPLVLLVALAFRLTLPSWASTLLIVAFVGGFGVLVATMDNEPRDPGDDGAVV